MRASLAADGRQSAVTVLATASAAPHRFVLVDGYLRVAALRALGRGRDVDILTEQKFNAAVKAVRDRLQQAK